MKKEAWYFIGERRQSEQKFYFSDVVGWILLEDQATRFATREGIVEALRKTDIPREELFISHCSPVVNKETMFDVVEHWLEANSQ